MNNLRQIALAIHNYEADHGHFPPPYLVDDEGSPLHSWRVILLPYLGYGELYERIKLDLPWDDPTNQPFHDQMPEDFSCAAVRHYSMWREKGNTTPYVALIGERTMWPTGDSLNERTWGSIIDGSSNTALILESEAHQIPWMAPLDPKFDSFDYQAGLKSAHPESTIALVALGDGSVSAISSTEIPPDIEKLFGIDDGTPENEW